MKPAQRSMPVPELIISRGKIYFGIAAIIIGAVLFFTYLALQFFDTPYIGATQPW